MAPLPSWIDVSQRGAGFDMVDGVLGVIELEGPIHVQVLDQRLRDAWDIGRLGTKIRENINIAIKHSGAQREGDFLMMPSCGEVRVRTPSEATLRRADQIHARELGKAITALLAEMGSATTDQLLATTARLFGWGRVGAEIQFRLQEVLDKLVSEGHIRHNGSYLRLLTTPVS